MFTKGFEKFESPGKSIACEVEGFTVRARLHLDEDSRCEEGDAGYAAWCRDEWNYWGVSVTVFKHGVQLTGEFSHALWGIGVEETDDDYLREVANERIPEALADARAVLAKLCEGLHADSN